MFLDIIGLVISQKVFVQYNPCSNNQHDLLTGNKTRFPPTWATMDGWSMLQAGNPPSRSPRIDPRTSWRCEFGAVLEFFKMPLFWSQQKWDGTVDGKSPAKQLIWQISHLCTGWNIYVRWFSRRISEPSTESLPLSAVCCIHIWHCQPFKLNAGNHSDPTGHILRGKNDDPSCPWHSHLGGSSVIQREGKSVPTWWFLVLFYYLSMCLLHELQVVCTLVIWLIYPINLF